jgi:hypothetical protein
MENDMRSKLFATTAVLALTACTVLASSAPASAQWRGGWHGGGWHGGGWGWPAAAAAGIVGGAVAAATSPLWAPGYYDSYPGYAYGSYGYAPYNYGNGTYGYGYPAPATVTVAPGTEVAQGDTTAWCAARYRSFDPASGTYLGFDGMRHTCP